MRPDVTVEIPMTLPSVANKREHWGTKARRVKAQRACTALCLRANGVGWRLAALTETQRLVVTLVRIAPRRLDDDNLRGAFKAVRDEVAAFFHIDDGDSRIVFEYQQRPMKPRPSLSSRQSSRHSRLPFLQLRKLNL